MEFDLGKLFVGGISWDTDESRLREYFGQYGQVVEAVIMRDRITGRARGFGFIVFADPDVAERVVLEKHIIDGRTVEAKKAVPRDDQQILSRNNNSVQGSPVFGRTKKIFVGGLASTANENDLKTYFCHFGTITDVVVMYDHNTQRPRGFGFITFDSEDAVDRVLHKTFHELSGKMVEVKRAVPKEMSPGPSRSPLVGYNYGTIRANNDINSYAQGFSMSTIGGYGSLNPLVSGRSGLPPFANPGSGMGISIGPGMNAGYGANSNFSNSHVYGRVSGPYYSGNSNRYNTPIGYNEGIVRGDRLGSSPAHNVWENGSFGNPTIPRLGSAGENFGYSLGIGGSNWGSSPNTPQNGDNGSGLGSGNLGYALGESSYGFGTESNERTLSTEVTPPSSFASSSAGLDTSYGDLYRGGSAYADSVWRSGSPDINASATFGFGLSNAATDATAKTSERFMGNYRVVIDSPERVDELLRLVPLLEDLAL